MDGGEIIVMLDHNSVVPLYTQVYDSIRQEIMSGKLKARQRLPTEENFAEQYGVSIITIRRAIAELVKENLVEKKQGKGTFVAAPKYTKSFRNHVMSFSETCASNGIQAGAKVLEIGVKEPDIEIRKKLQMKKGQKAIYILRLRLADNVPCLIEENYFVPEFEDLLLKDLENDSIYRILREDRGIEIMPGPLTLRIVRANGVTAKHLEVAKGTPLIKMVGLSYQSNGAPLHTCTQIGFGEDFEFVLR
jgi:GntR family transcriptional regulator